MNIRIQTIFSFFLLVFTGFCLVACQQEEAGEEAGSETTETTAETSPSPESTNVVELTAAQYKMASIQLGKPEPKNLSQVIPANGALDVPPQNLVTISAPLGGFVKNTELLQGMQVKKGQVIAIIENPDFIDIQQEYLENKSHLEYLELEYARQKELATENISATKTFQQTTAEYKSIQSRVHALAEKLALIGISTKQVEQGKITRTVAMYAPISGYVTEVHVNIGKFVSPTDVLFEIVDTEHLHVELTVYERDVTKLRPGQKIRFTLPNESNRERTATLYLIGREISPERTIRVHAHLDKEDTQLIPGMYVKAFIEIENAAVSALPAEAVLQSEGKAYVFVYTGKRKTGKAELSVFEMQEVSKGIVENGFIEVNLPKITASDSTRIVVKGAYSLLAKMKNIEEEE